MITGCGFMLERIDLQWCSPALIISASVLLLSSGGIFTDQKKRTKLYKKCQQKLLVLVNENKKERVKERRKQAVKNSFLVTKDYVKHKAENEN